MRGLMMLALGAALVVRAAGAAFAQTVPEGQSCGGLLCDLGVLGHKTSGDTAAVTTRAEPGPVAPAAAPAIAASTPPLTSRTRRVAKASGRSRKAVVAAKTESGKKEARSEHISIETTNAGPMRIRPPHSAPAQARSTAAKAPASEGTNILNPYARPLPPNFNFQPIYR